MIPQIACWIVVARSLIIWVSCVMHLESWITSKRQSFQANISWKDGPKKQVVKVGSACNKEGSIIDVNPNVALTKHNDEICFAFKRLASEAALTKEATTLVLSHIDEMLLEVQKYNALVAIEMGKVSNPNKEIQNEELNDNA